MKIKNLLLLAIVLNCFRGFAQASDTLGFDLTFMLDCKVRDFENYNLSFVGDNSSFWRCEYELTPIDSGISIRIYGRYEYVVTGLETFSPILVISKNRKSEGHVETLEQYFVQLIGFQANDIAYGIKTVVAPIGKIDLYNPNHYIRVYKGKPMINGNIQIKYNWTLEENALENWQRKLPYVTVVTRVRP